MGGVTRTEPVRPEAQPETRGVRGELDRRWAERRRREACESRQEKTIVVGLLRCGVKCSEIFSAVRKCGIATTSVFGDSLFTCSSAESVFKRPTSAGQCAN